LTPPSLSIHFPPAPRCPEAGIVYGSAVRTSNESGSVISSLNPSDTSITAGMVASANESARASFIRRTYTQLAGGVFAFLALEAALFMIVPEPTRQSLVRTMTGGNSWLLVLGAFMGVS